MTGWTLNTILKCAEKLCMRRFPGMMNNLNVEHNDIMPHMPWASYQIRKIAGVHAPGIPERFPRHRWLSDPDMHHGTYVTHVPWCMPGSLTSSFIWSRRCGETFPAFLAHAQPTFYVSGKRPMETLSAQYWTFVGGIQRSPMVSPHKSSNAELCRFLCW